MKRTVTEFDVLSRAFEILQAGWCQFAFARNEEGKIVHLFSENARRFCATGAMKRAACFLDADAITRIGAWIVLKNSLGYPTRLPAWNDSKDRTHSEVLALFQRAATQARGEGEK